jgi:isopenicillin N synthase-like dioxygenase
MYFDAQGNVVEGNNHDNDNNHDNNDNDKSSPPSTSRRQQGGLHIKSRTGQVHRVSIPEAHLHTSLAFQVGETTQIMTGGILQATPHAVQRGTSNHDQDDAADPMTREAMAVFMQPEYPFPLLMPRGIEYEAIQSLEAQQQLPHTIRTLQSRFTHDGMTFGQFSKTTFAAFS